MLLGHAGTGHGEGGEHANGVEGNEAVDLRVKRDRQDQGHRGQRDDAVREGQAVTALGELARQVLVGGHVVGQVGKAVETGVTTGEQDQGGGGQHQVIKHVSEAVITKDGEHLLRQHGGRSLFVGERVGPARQEGHAQQQSAEDAGHDHHDDASVVALGAAEGLHAVTDGLESRQ